MAVESPRCPKCGAARPTLGSADYCPACLLTAALSNDDEPCPYQVIAPMAEDARGVIYLAQPIARPRGYVALKVHGPRDDVDAVLARYRRWRPAVERLGHPSIGRLLDIGTTADGCLYVAT
jgi:hypothetical protein